MKERIRRFILGDSEDLLHGLDFGSVALSLYRWQRAHNPDYDAFCGPASPERWEDIPAVPVSLFRDLSLCSFEPDDAQIVFRTSGTTGRRGVHRMLDTELYNLGSIRHAAAVCGPLPALGVSLVSHSEDSSLGHMCQHFISEMPHFFDPEAGVDSEGAWAAIRASREPIFIPMTGLAAALLLEREPEPVTLAPGSLVMVTGGFKGRKLAVDEETLHRQIARTFPGARIVGEYGMTELSSQLWSESLGQPFIPPPWLKVRAVDPWTGESVDEGLLRFYDLANHQSVLAIETGDIGRVLSDGRVELRGRISGAATRGCSLSVEEAVLAELVQADPVRPSPEESHAHAVQAAPLPPHVHVHDEHCGHGEVCEASADVAPLSETCPADADRIERVFRALANVRRENPVAFGDGLSRSQAMGAYGMAIAGITREGLEAELVANPERPADVSLVVARGVFTAPIEWVALYAAAGITVRLKPPSDSAEMCRALARHFTAQDLPVELIESRDLGTPAAIVGFGSDESMAAIASTYPAARRALFGHRFSVALAPPSMSQVLAWEVAHYDTRGCMAPAALFCLEDPRPHLEALASAMTAAERAMPRGEVDGSLGPEWRRRCGLARTRGQLQEGKGWAICVLPVESFSPVALPRMLTIHHVEGPEALYRALSPWRDQLSTLGTDDLLRTWRSRVWEEVYGWFPRRVPIGQMQKPTLPRLHDGLPMLGAICGD